MRIKNIAFDNLRSYKGSNQFELSNINVLIGPNNSGKSNLLHYLQLYRELNLGKRSINQDQRHTGKREAYPHKFEIEYELDDSEIELINSYDGKKLFDNHSVKGIKHEIVFDPFVKKEVLYFKDSQDNWISLFDFEKSSKGSEIFLLEDSYFVDLQYKTKTRNIEPSNVTVFFHLFRDAFIDKFKSIFTEKTKTLHLINALLSIISSYITRWAYLPAFRTISGSVIRSESKILSEDGSNLISVLHYLQMWELKTFNLIHQILEKADENIISFTAPPRDQTAYGLINEKGDVTVELLEFSTGLQQLLLIITFVVIAPPNSLLMIEEPEENIHAKTQRTLLKEFEQFSKERHHQFILTSHSTIFARVTPTINTMKIEKKNGISNAIRLQETSELKFIKNVLGHENSDLFNYNAVIIVEGETEENVLPLIAQNMSVDFVERGIKIINVGGSGNVQKIKELVNYLRDSQTETYVILDNHDDSKAAVKALIENDALKEENVCSGDKGFEDLFDDDTIIEAFKTYCNGASLEKVERDSRPIYESIKKAYYEKTQKSINKPLFGLALVNSAIKNGTIKDNLLYKFLMSSLIRIP